MQIEIFLIAEDDHHRSHHHHHHQSLSHFTQGRQDTENTAPISSLSEIKGKCWEFCCYHWPLEADCQWGGIPGEACRDPGQAKSCWLEWDMREGAAWPPLHTAPNELRENSWDFILIRKVSLTLASRYGCEAMIWKCVGCLRPILYIDSGDGLSRSPGHLITLRHRLWREFWDPRTKLLKMLNNNAAHVFVAEGGSLTGFQFNLYSEWNYKSIRIFSATTFYFTSLIAVL